MEKIKKLILSPTGNLVLFILAALLLLGSSIGGARAALNYFSETYATRIEMYNIGVTLLENGEKVSWRDYTSASDGTWDENIGVLLGNMLKDGESVQLGRAYPEELSVRNSGFINQYVRVEIRKYWLDANGNKMQELTPDLIQLNLLCDATGHDNGWMLDKDASTPERTVLYYNQLLYSENEEEQAGPSVSEPFSDTLSISPAIEGKVSQSTSKKDGYTTITTTYDYNGVQFRIEAQVHAVQEHNAKDAAWSAWGRKVTVKDGILSLN